MSVRRQPSSTTSQPRAGAQPAPQLSDDAAGPFADKAVAGPAAPAATRGVQADGTPAGADDGVDDLAPLRDRKRFGNDLPQKLMTTTSGVDVRHGTDAGNFYCEHMFFRAQQVAATTSYVRKNAQNEPLVGFLHIPGTGYEAYADPKVSALERHGTTREVVGAALRGYIEDASAGHKDAGPVRVLLTGYGPFSYIVSNPTGDFVSNSENLDAAMRSAYGDRLVGAGTDVEVPYGDGGEVGDVQRARRYAVRMGGPGSRVQEVLVQTRSMPTDDVTIGDGPSSIAGAMKAFRPNAVLSLGVAAFRTDFLAEHHADNGGLRQQQGVYAHDDGAAPDVTLPENYSLARAIWKGSKPLPVTIADLIPASELRKGLVRLR